MENEKNTTEHIDAVESANTSDHDVPLNRFHDANEEIVQHLQTTGEEVGMTWRTFMAAAVCLSISNCQTVADWFSQWPCATTPTSSHSLFRLQF